MNGYVTYYWQSSDKSALQEVLFTSALNEDGTYSTIAAIDNLGIAEGNGVYGSIGTFYTCARSETIMQTPSNCQISDPYVVSNLIGVWA